jgi:hypothetical protein
MPIALGQREKRAGAEPDRCRALPDIMSWPLSFFSGFSRFNLYLLFRILFAVKELVCIMLFGTEHANTRYADSEELKSNGR